MNIVVFGGGRVGKFGNDFCLRARKEGHKVIIFSHRSNGTNDSDQYILNYMDMDQCTKVFDKACGELESFDLVLFNQIGGGYPAGEEIFKTPNLNQYIHTVSSHAMIPHLFLTHFKNKIVDTTKVVNMTSNMAFDYNTNNWLSTLIGYASGKSWATHMIQKLAKLRKNKTVYVTISPSINYETDEGKANYPIWLDSVYNLIFSLNESNNGTIIAAFHANEHYPLKITMDRQ